MALLRIAGIVPESITDGPGLRFTLFCQGCRHACPGCHNMATWPFSGGTLYTPEAIFNEVQKHPLVKGVTFSGGEPMEQAEGLCELATMFLSKGYEIALYTGYTFEELLLNGTAAQKELLNRCHILIDGRFIQGQRNLSLPFRGSENQRILNLQKSLAAGAPIVEGSPRWAGISDLPF